MNRLLIRLFINALALYIAVGTGWLPGIHAETSTWWTFLLLALVFGLVNAIIRPLLKLLTCPLIVLTLGLFTLVINTVLFWLTGWIGNQFPMAFGFVVDSVWAALLGAVVVTVVNGILTLALKEELEPRSRSRNR